VQSSGYNSRVFFRANTDFMAAARKLANQRNRSLSALIRESIAHELVRASTINCGRKA
jgi:predicted transcriptional regulator